MRTPAGFDCPYFHGDYFRGREHEECLLIGTVPPPNHWRRELCKHCPVPSITRANACSNLVLTGKVVSFLFGLGRHMEVAAWCTKSQQDVPEPAIGCGQCHPLPPVFLEKP